MAIGIPMINGQAYSWASIRLNLFGRTVMGITAIEYDDPEVKENLYGQGQHPVERGKGNIEPKASITLYLSEVEAILESARQQGITRLQDIPPFEVPVSFLRGTKVTNHTLSYVEFTNNPISSKQGDTKVEVKLDLVIGSVERA